MNDRIAQYFKHRRAAERSLGLLLIECAEAGFQASYVRTDGSVTGTDMDFIGLITFSRASQARKSAAIKFWRDSLS